MTILEGSEFSLRKPTFPERWYEEGSVPPNSACMMKAFHVCKQIFERCQMVPARIAPSKENGIYIAFDSSDKSKTLWMEVYNDLEIAYLLNDNFHKIIIESGDFIELDDIPYEKINQLNDDFEEFEKQVEEDLKNPVGPVPTPKLHIAVDKIRRTPPSPYPELITREQLNKEIDELLDKD